MENKKNNDTVIEALKRVIGREGEFSKVEEVRGQESLFMNQTRQRIFQYLCQYPCVHFSEIARELKLSTPTLRWHIEKLEGKEFISKKRIGNKLVYFPVGMVSANDIDVLYLLHKDKVRRIMLLIYNREGLSQKGIQAETRINGQTLIGYLKKLEGKGLISSLEDGRFKRYYPTNKLYELTESHRQGLRRFRSTLYKRLVGDGVAPRIVRNTEKELHIEVRGGKEKTILILHTSPFMTVFQKSI